VIWRRQTAARIGSDATAEAVIGAITEQNFTFTLDPIALNFFNKGESL
jgi:hypothetical protein